MSYDKGFYEAYRKYLDEPATRARHEQILNMLGLRQAKNIIDLGCGLSEVSQFMHPNQGYVGLDLNAEHIKKLAEDGRHLLFRRPVPRTIARDYRDLAEVLETAYVVDANAFVSLFSSEITAPAEQNYRLYTGLMKSDQFKFGIVSGFYYSDKRGIQPVRETGDVVSFQTLENAEDADNDVFGEIRVITHAPSAMFGPNVYEVWKRFDLKPTEEEKALARAFESESAR